MTYQINVFEDEYHSEVVARVKYNEALDYWDGRNWTNGGLGRHLGITKLKDGRYVLIYGTHWQGEKDYGMIVTSEEALNEILKSNNAELLDQKKFEDLRTLAEAMNSEYEIE
ncbi:hypothetical protein [Paraliobacillus sp. X-1268]|uniref:hypothetical protein n=1 Tax=Paraliobacillus sp. X-1268 TaxID=2213193 RepID=UPI000E3D2594|nr:hypothetical protein [Paraliobacillus sp. X-1268]